MQRKIFIERLDEYNEKLLNARSKEDLDKIARELGATNFRGLYNILWRQGARTFYVPLFFKKEEDERIGLE